MRLNTIIHLSAFLLAGLASNAQTSLFTTAIIVNGQGISNYEISQRIKMSKVLGGTNVSRKVASEDLVEERLYLQEASRLGLTLTNKELLEGIESYAQNYNRTTNQLYSLLQRNGIDREIFREFARAGILWQKAIELRFTDDARSLTVQDLNRIVKNTPVQSSTMVHLSEIAFDIDSLGRENATQLAEDIRINVTSSNAFSEAARIYSVASSRNNDGDIGTLNLNSLPNNIRNSVNSTRSGSISEPILYDGYVYIFYVHSKRTDRRTADLYSIEYATLSINNGDRQSAQKTARELIKSSTRCKDLELQANANPVFEYERVDVRATEISDSIKSVLDGLDTSEATIRDETASGGTINVMMVCDRNYLPDNETAQALLTDLRGQYVDVSARNYLSKLLANAIIHYK